MKPPMAPKLTHEELLASIAAKHAAQHTSHSAWYTPHRLLNAAAEAPALPDKFDTQEPNPRWLADDELANELALMQEAAHTPLHGPGKWLAGALLAAAAVVVLALAYVEGV